MSAVQAPRRSTRVVMMHSLLWLWVLCLSAFVALGYQAIHDRTGQEQVDSRLQLLDAQLASLTETTQALQRQPAAATAVSLQDLRQTLDTRITEVEQVLNDRAANDDLHALRAEVERIKARRTPARTAVPTQPRAPDKPVATKPESPPPLPFRVVGVELRAGALSVSVVPRFGDFTADQLQVLLPGDAFGPWRLQAIESGRAVFQAGDQVRHAAIP